jgi:hypothetical protein
MHPLVGAAFVLAMLYVVVPRIRARFQNVSQGADQVAKQLGNNTVSNNSETSVEVWNCYPLTIPMIRALAESMGYKYTEYGFSRVNGARVLRFTPPKPKQRRLEL